MHEMRRGKQALSTQENKEIIQRNTSGTLAVLDEDNTPYAVPLSYVYCNDCLYFHCAKSGHKIRAIEHHEKASFCIIDQDEIVPEKFTTKYRSVILFGCTSFVENEDEKQTALDAFAQKYSPAFLEESKDEIKRSFAYVNIIKLDIESMSGKQAKELLNEA